MLYVKLKKALYGTLQATLLFWRLLSSTLKEWVFKLIEYDKCIANKTINIKRCTIIWHVDNLKISHVDKRVVEAIIKCLNEKFGQESPLSTTQGKVLEYLGIHLDYTTAGKVKISIHEYIDKMLMKLPIDMNGTARPPASRHIFNVNQLVAKLLYLSRRI